MYKVHFVDIFHIISAIGLVSTWDVYFFACLVIFHAFVVSGLLTFQN